MADIQTFKNLQDKVLNWLDEAGDTDTTLTLVKQAIQAAHRRRVAQERWPFMLWDSEETLAIVPGQQVYVLHPEYLRPLYFWNTTIAAPVTQRDDATFRSSLTDSHVDHTSAVEMVLWGRTEIAAQPSSASVIAVASSVVGDNGSATVIIRGVTALGVKSETITANSSGSTQFTKILKVTKVGVWAGTMTLTSNAGAVTNLVLFAEEKGRSYQQVFFLGIPDSAETVAYRFYRQPSLLVNDDDRPDIPTPFEELLVYDTLLSFAGYNQYDVQTVRIWQTKQSELELSLQQAYVDAESLDAATNYTTFIPR